MGILDGIAYGLAGGLKGGAEAVGQVADDQIKLNNQQLLQKQMSDLHTQEEQSVASYKNNLELSNQAANRARVAGYNTNDEDLVDPESGSTVKGGFNYQKTRDKAIAGGDYAAAADLDKAQGDKTVGYGGVLVDASGKPIYDNSTGRNAANALRAEAALAKTNGKTLDPLQRAQEVEKLQSVAGQDFVKNYRQPTLGTGLDGKPIRDDMHFGMASQLYNDEIYSQYSKDPQSINFAEARANAEAFANKAAARARSVVAKTHGGKFDPTDMDQVNAYGELMNGYLQNKRHPIAGAAPAATDAGATPTDPSDLFAAEGPGNAPPAPQPILRAAMRGRQNAPITNPVVLPPPQHHVGLPGRAPIPASAQGQVYGQ